MLKSTMCPTTTNTIQKAVKCLTSAFRVPPTLNWNTIYISKFGNKVGQLCSHIEIMIIIMIIIIIIIRLMERLSQSLQIRSKRCRAGSIEAYCQWALLVANMYTLLLSFTVNKYVFPSVIIIIDWQFCKFESTGWIFTYQRGGANHSRWRKPPTVGLNIVIT